MFSAYYRPWRRREDLERDGFFLTGDIARLEDDGCITLVGRRKSMIFVGGMKFFPEEVEAVLDQHPDVCESRVWARSRIPNSGKCLEPTSCRQNRRSGSTSARSELISASI